MNAPAHDAGPPLDAIRERLRGMSDAELEAHGKALQFMTDPKIQREIRATYRVQLAQARAEWRRRKAATEPQ